MFNRKVFLSDLAGRNKCIVKFHLGAEVKLMQTAMIYLGLNLAIPGSYTYSGNDSVLYEVVDLIY